ncbi:MAG: prolipoprotein diacylglyceryl transferase [Clostridia bacterium]|nr:prolipoprotein diacylglyceryl transferase [Clostridia bacterium]
MNTVFSFPGLGIGETTISKIAVTLPFFGGFEVRWYGVLLTLGIVAGFLYAVYRAKFEGIKTDDILDFALVVVVLAIVGARAYYVLTTLDEGHYTSFYDVIAIWEGGIALYGSIIGGAAGILLVSYFKKFNKTQILKMCDLVAPGVMLGQIIGRWGNFVNGEAHGTEITGNFFLRMGLREGLETVYYHPTFLYESLWNLVGFVLINLYYKKKKFNGQILLLYLAWYGFGRMLIEGLRTDSLYVGGFRISQVVGFLCFIVCTALIVYLLWRGKRAEADAVEYQPVYEKCRGISARTREKQQAEQEAAADIDAMIANAAKQNEKQKGEQNDGNAD